MPVWINMLFVIEKNFTPSDLARVWNYFLV